jgi:hypothetical protein
MDKAEAWLIIVQISFFYALYTEEVSTLKQWGAIREITEKSEGGGQYNKA